MKIEKVSFISGVHKLELPEILDSVVEIVEKHNPESLGINGMFQLLKAEMPGVKELEVQKSKSTPGVEQLKVQRKRRNDLIGVILNQCKSIEKADVEIHRPSRELVLPILRLHLKDFVKANAKEKMSYINRLLLELKDANIAKAVTELGMVPYIEELKNVQSAMLVSNSLKKEVITTSKRSELQTVKKGAFSAFRNLMKAIELASIEHKDKDYSVLVSELNNYLSSESSSIKSRRTRRVNSSKKETAASTPTSLATAS